MARGDFVWCDLSTFRIETALAFYEDLFGWSYNSIYQPDGTPYQIASTGQGEAAGLFEMPKKFQEIGMPSFWMSYIQVDNAAATVAEANRSGGKVEVGPVAFDESSQIALIRDPLGAGFTVYQGSDLQPRHGDMGGPGQMIWNALYVSDPSAVTGFYEALFDWRISTDAGRPGVHAVHNEAGHQIASIHAASDQFRGGYEFWGVHFSVQDLAQALAGVGQGGGEVLGELDETARRGTLVRDPDGAAFFLVDGSESTPTFPD